MPTRHIGGNAKVKLNVHGSPLVDISGHLSGLASTEVNEVRDSREIPGGGSVVGSQLLPWRDGTGRLTVDINSVTAPLLWGRNGQRFDVEVSPEGDTTGLPQETFEAILDITIRYNARGVVTADCGFNVDGRITRGTHS